MTHSPGCWPVLFIGAGVILLLHNLGLAIPWQKYWPALLILLGLWMLVAPGRRRRAEPTSHPPDGSADESGSLAQVGEPPAPAGTHTGTTGAPPQGPPAP